MGHQVLKLSSAVGALVLASAIAAHAQQAQSVTSAKTGNSDTANTGEIETVVVTAEKRSQAINDVGFTVANISNRQIVDFGVTDISDLSMVVPSFTASKSYDGQPVFSIRGIGYNAVQISAAPTVSAYVDEAPLPYSAMTGGTMLDLDRVEVLKGPQGTLFGNNSTGGSINFIAAKPTDDFSAGFRTSVNNFGQIFVEGFISGPISDTVSVRVAANTTQGGAWQESYTPGPKETWGRADKGAQRVIVDWRPNDKLNATATFNANFDYSQPQIFQLGLAQPSGGPGSAIVVPPYGSISTYPLPPHNNRAADYAQNPATPYETNDTLYQGVVRGEYAISNDLMLISISNYAALNSGLEFPLDGTRINIIEGGHDGSVQTYGEELRLMGDFPDIGLHTIVGGNYSNDIVNESAPYLFNNFSIVPPGFDFDPEANFASKTFAGFANGDWDFTKQFTLTAGVRFTTVEQTYAECFPKGPNGTSAAFEGGLANIFRGIEGLPPTTAYATAQCVTLGPPPDYLPFEYTAASTDHNTSWRVGLNYKPIDDLLIYGLISRGYKAGGYPFVIPVVSSEFHKVQQEELTDYEGGFKYGGDTLNVSGAGFYYDYNNKQIYGDIPVPFLGPVVSLSNIPKSKAYGAEFEATVIPIERLTLHGALTYLKTEITDPGSVDLDGFGNVVNFVGHPFPYAPQWSVVFDGEYRIPLANQLDGIIGVSGTYDSISYGDSVATAPFEIKPYTILDARVGVESGNGWEVTAWVHNLADTWYWTTVNFAGDGYERTTGEPRTFGLTASYKF